MTQEITQMADLEVVLARSPEGKHTIEGVKYGSSFSSISSITGNGEDIFGTVDEMTRKGLSEICRLYNEQDQLPEEVVVTSRPDLPEKYLFHPQFS